MGDSEKAVTHLLEKIVAYNLFPDKQAGHIGAEDIGGDIILMHDNSQQIIEALPMIIKNLKRRGYQFLTVSKMIKT